MVMFDEPECPNCGYIFSYEDYWDGQIEYDEIGDIVLLECPKCGEQFTEIISDIESD